jgi:hypothetical protein
VSGPSRYLSPDFREEDAVARSDDTEGPFEIRPLTIPIYVEARLGRRRDARGGDEVRGYALAIGWRPRGGADLGTYEGQAPPEIAYLVADPRQPRPTWVPESAVQKHFRTFLSGVPEPAEDPG